MQFSRFEVAMMVDESQVQPHSIMEALILWTEAQIIVRNGDCTMLTYFPSSIRV